MIIDLQKRFDKLESKRISFFAQLNALTAEQLAFRPHADHWNMQDIAQHLMLSESAFLLQVTEKTFKPRKARFHPIAGTVIVWIVFKFGFHVKAPAKSVIPTEPMTVETSSVLWSEKRTVLKNYLEMLNETSARKKTFFHPVRGPIHTYALLDFLIIHFDHHMKQVKRIRRSPLYPN